MVVYKSRINKRVLAKKKPTAKTTKKMTTTGDQASRTKLFENSELPVGSGIVTGGVLRTGGSVTTGGSVQTGGNIPALSIPAGGVLRTGGVISSDSEIDLMKHDDMVHMLSNMDNGTYHMMQGIGGALLGMDHPLAEIMKRHLAGPFVHPKNIAKMATKDLLKASHPLQLAQAMHGEGMDAKRGLQVGGGLLDSLKNILKKGVSGARRAVAAGPGIGRKALQSLAGARMIGSQLSNAIKKGIEVARVLSPIAEAVGLPSLAGPLGVAERARGAVETGLSLAEQAQAGLEPLLGGMDEPLVVLE